MSHLFISYSRKHEAIVSEVAEILKEQGISIWQDVSGKASGIPFSTKWFEVIEDALYNSAGAIIFDSAEWRKSDPCKREFDIIEKNSIPYKTVNLEDGTNAQTMAYDIVSWYEHYVSNEENDARTWLFAQARSFQRNKAAATYSKPKAKRIGEAFAHYRYLCACRYLLREERYVENNPEFALAIDGFLKMAKRKIVVRQTTKALGLLLAFSAVTAAWIGIELFSELVERSEASTTSRILINTTYRVAEYNPINAMSLLSSPAFFDPNQSLFLMQSAMLEFGSRVLPTSFFPNGSYEADAFKRDFVVQESSNFVVTLSETNGSVFVTDIEKDVTRQLLLDCRPSDYSLNDDETLLALAAANRAYVFDLRTSTFPTSLEFNFESIEKIGWREDQIFGITQRGNVVVWDNPIAPQINSRSNLGDSAMYLDDNGEMTALYIDEGSLIVNSGNVETVFPLKLNGVLDAQRVAISNDRTVAALSYAPADSDVDHIVIVDVTSGEIVSDYSTETSITDFVFSADDRFIVAACFGFRGIVKIDLSDGSTQFSGHSEVQNFAIALYGDRYLVADAFGRLAQYNSSLEQVGDWISVTNTPVPTRQIAVAAERGFVFTANRGGASLGRSARTSLADGNQNIFISQSGENVVSTTAVAVSPDENFVAFAYPDGQIWIYDVRAMNALWADRSIAEPVITLSFSADSDTVYALGSSGTIYSFCIEAVWPVPSAEYTVYFWQLYVNRAVEKHRQMYDLGLSYITPCSFIQHSIQNE